MKMRVQALALVALSRCSPPAVRQGPGQGGVQGRQQGIQGRELQAGHRATTSAAVEHDPELRRGLVLPGQLQPGDVPPGQGDAREQGLLEKAIEAYKKSLEVNPGTTENQKKVKLNTLGALTAIYSDDPSRTSTPPRVRPAARAARTPTTPRTSTPWPTSTRSSTRSTRRRRPTRRSPTATRTTPRPAARWPASTTSPLWRRDRGARSKFDQAIEMLQRCATPGPERSPAATRRSPTFYWDKAYRDPLHHRRAEAASTRTRAWRPWTRRCELKPDYFEAIIYKGLLYRVKARRPRTRASAQQYLDQASRSQKQGLELRKQQQAAEAAAAAAGGRAPSVRRRRSKPRRPRAPAAACARLVPCDGARASVAGSSAPESRTVVLVERAVVARGRCCARRASAGARAV